MENESKIKVALVRGDSLGEWEGRLWEDPNNIIDTTAFCSKKALYNTDRLKYPIKRLPCSTDNYFVSNIYKYTGGIFQKMVGLESELKNFDIAHTAEIFYYFTAQAVRAKKLNPRLKVVTTVWDNSFGRFEYNYWPGISTPPKYWRKKIYSIINENCAGVDLFLPVSNYSAEMLRDFGVPISKIQLLPPAIADQSLSDDQVDLGIDMSGQKLYLSVCRLVKSKGVYDVLYAWRIFLRDARENNKKLIFVGSGPEKNNMKRLAHDLGLDNSVIFAGNLPNSMVRTLNRKAKCLILASLPTSVWQEQFGFAIAESIQANCPVVAASSGAIPEVVENAGLLFSPGNPMELANNLRKLDDPIIFEQLQHNCSIVQKKFSAQLFRTRLIDIYQHLLHD